MIPRECKRLAEVDFPIAVVSKHAVAEKESRRGHIPKIHIWPAARPTASSRAVLLALLLPDPCDEHCPPEFKTGARDALAAIQKIGPSDNDLRDALLKFTGDFANWDLAANQLYLEAGRALVRAAHPEEPPLVVDPFAGGGSIPLEALRLGCDAFAADLNPVANMILRVVVSQIPRDGNAISARVLSAGMQVKDRAERELRSFYPPDPDGSQPIAYIWARTVSCETPGCGAEIPLVRSCWLSKKPHRKRAFRYFVTRSQSGLPQVEFEILEPTSASDVPRGTVSGGRATCPACGIVLGPDRVRAQLTEQHGGADVVFDNAGKRKGGARLMAVAALRSDTKGRLYRIATDGDYVPVLRAAEELASRLPHLAKEGIDMPNEPLPPVGTLGFRVQRYGMTNWGDLTTIRQKLALLTIAGLIREQDDDLRAFLSLAFSKIVDMNSSLSTWQPSANAEIPAHMMTRFALPMKWDFAEAVPIGESSGTIDSSIRRSVAPVSMIAAVATAGTVQPGDARRIPLPDESADVWFTDPPYYDAVPYADLSDFFLVWIRRAFPPGTFVSDPFDATNSLAPKLQEIVQDESKELNGAPKDRAFFEHAMAEAFAEGRRVLTEDGLGAVVFAHKTTEGWEALLSGAVSGGWTVTASWPIATEMGSRLRARASAALATSVHLVCRPRPGDAPIGEWADVLRELPRRVGDWMERLQGEGVRGADLVFACIGPALEVYSRYSKVVDAEDREIPLGGDPEAVEPHERGYLAYVWEVVGRAALRQVLGSEDDAGALEEDARLTSLFLWTLQSTNGGQEANGAAANAGPDEDGAVEEDAEEEESSARRRKPKGYTLVYDVVRRFAQPLGIHLDDWEGRIIETTKGVVRLLPVAERAKRLFGEDGAQAVADRLEAEPSAQLSLFLEMQGEPKPRRGRRKVVVTATDEAIGNRLDATTLDRVHAAMLLQASGRANALRTLLATEQERGPDFLRLANALSALYPRNAEEKRLLDAMLLAMPK